jgi:2-oxoglutarate ferredoxin oxidoreductase subunit delta
VQKEAEITINRRWCKACGICIDLCPKTVYTRDELGRPQITSPEKCIQCRMCEYRCPDFAVTVRGKQQ